MRAAARWLPFAAGCLAIFVVSGMSQPPMPDRLAFPHADKVMHGAAYCGLGVLGVVGGWPRLWLPFGVTVAYGAFDEVHQAFVPGRDASLLDLVADASGAAGACALGAVWRRRARPRARSQPS